MNPMVFTILAAERQLAERQQALQTAWDKPAGGKVAPAMQPHPQPRRSLLPWSRSEPASECSESC